MLVGVGELATSLLVEIQLMRRFLLGNLRRLLLRLNSLERVVTRIYKRVFLGYTSLC